MDISKLKDEHLLRLINNRWESASTIWDTIKATYDRTTCYYDMDPSTLPDHMRRVPAKSHKVRSNRIFRDMESVINSVIANPPKPNVIPSKETPEAKEMATRIDRFLSQKYDDLDVKSDFRRALRFLYFARLLVLKPYWNVKTNDIDISVVDPRKIRLSPKATNEQNTDWIIEEIECSITALIERFPEKQKEILKKAGFSSVDEAIISDKEVTYREAWIGDYVVRLYGRLVLERKKNPYWDWDGMLLTADEDIQVNNNKESMSSDFWTGVENTQEDRQLYNEQAKEMNAEELQAFYFNHFDRPRKPYIFATLFNDEQKPIGRTSFIEQAIPLQEAVDRRKRQIDDNAQMVNGILKVDSGVMSQTEANKLRYDTGGVIWGKGVRDGVNRETGNALPSFVYEDMVDSRSEIDNIMAASSAFRGEREGSETKAGRLALIDQSYMGLNELVQVVDYTSRELFNWFYQLAKLNYTETHYTKTMGADKAVETIEMTRNDMIEGADVRVIPGKTIPEDRKFRFERAQGDRDILALPDYFAEVGYDDPKGLAQKAMGYKADPFASVGIEPPPEIGVPGAPAAKGAPDLEEQQVPKPAISQ
jgi:hypothetical protein